MFFSITRFEPFSANDALVVGQVEGRCLHAAIAIARREDGVDDANRRQRTQLGVAILRIDRQVVLDLLQLGSETRQLLCLRIVAKRDERLERGLVVEPLVLVDLVGPIVGSMLASSSIHAMSLS